MTGPEAGAGVIRVRIPAPYRCAVALTCDTDMAIGYAPPGAGCHGRTAPFVANYMRGMMGIAERFGTRLHFFKIANGLEDGCDYSVYREALERGHDVDSHTYSHVNLASTPPERLNDELLRANLLLKAKLGVDPVVLRGPGGYPAGALGPASRKVILASGFRFVSGEYNGDLYRGDMKGCERDAAVHPPHSFPDGLVELPVHGKTDRAFFDQDKCISPEAFLQWRAEHGHQPVASGWRCPWTAAGALREWIDLLKRCVDYVYDNRLLYVFCSHPYSHYLHDPENQVLGDLLSHIRGKEERVWVGTLRGVIRELLS